MICSANKRVPTVDWEAEQPEGPVWQAGALAALLFEANHRSTGTGPVVASEKLKAVYLMG